MEAQKQAADATAVVITGATFLGYLPSIAAVLTIIWTLLRIYETKTVQGWVARIRRRDD